MRMSFLWARDASHSSFFRVAREICSTRLTKGRISLFNTIRELQHYAMTLVLSETHPAEVVLSRDLQTFSIYGKTLSLAKWRAGLREVHDQVKGCIMKVLKGSLIPYAILDDIKDD